MVVVIVSFNNLSNIDIHITQALLCSKCRRHTGETMIRMMKYRDQTGRLFQNNLGETKERDMSFRVKFQVRLVITVSTLNLLYTKLVYVQVCI